MLGLLPGMLNIDDPRPAKEQLNDNYQYGGGWSPYPSGAWKLCEDHAPNKPARLQYPLDPPLVPIASCRLRDEWIVLYDCEIVAIFQKDGTFEACRMD